MTTLHYLVGRYRDHVQADKLVDWLLHYFDVATVGASELQRTRALNWPNFEDAVVADGSVARPEASVPCILPCRTLMAKSLHWQARDIPD